MNKKKKPEIQEFAEDTLWGVMALFHIPVIILMLGVFFFISSGIVNLFLQWLFGEGTPKSIGMIIMGVPFILWIKVIIEEFPTE